MAKTIVQQVLFSAKASQLYKFYMDSRKHTESTGGKARVTAKVGGSMTAWDGYIKGKILHLKPNRMITQTWRASNWPKTSLDSILTITFEDTARGCVVNLTHAGVPDKEASSLGTGWKGHYWNPWKKYLKNGGK